MYEHCQEQPVAQRLGAERCPGPDQLLKYLRISLSVLDSFGGEFCDRESSGLENDKLGKDLLC